jgi:hypothetical protein
MRFCPLHTVDSSAECQSKEDPKKPAPGRGLVDARKKLWNRRLRREREHQIEKVRGDLANSPIPIAETLVIISISRRPLSPGLKGKSREPGASARRLITGVNPKQFPRNDL